MAQAMAFQNATWLVETAKAGYEDGFRMFGHSLIVDPWGTPIARAGNATTAIIAEIDLDYLAQVRRELPCLEHRTFDV